MSMQCNSAVRTDNERKPFNRRTANSSPSASDETKQSAVKKKRLICYRCGEKGHPARLCPSADDCQDVDEVGTEPSRDADSDLFGLDWGDVPVATINSVTERNDRTRGGKELLAFVDSGAVDKVLPKSMCTEYPLEATSQSGVQTGHTSSTMGSGAFESRQALEAIRTPPGKSRMCANR